MNKIPLCHSHEGSIIEPAFGVKFVDERNKVQAHCVIHIAIQYNVYVSLYGVSVHT